MISYTYSIEQLRLLECWLPLADLMRQRHGWNDTPAELEQLIIDSAPALQRCNSLTEARRVLSMHHACRQALASRF